MDNGIFQMILILLFPQGMYSTSILSLKTVLADIRDAHISSQPNFFISACLSKNKDQENFLVKTAISGTSCLGNCCLQPRVTPTRLQRPLHTTWLKSNPNESSLTLWPHSRQDLLSE